MWHSVCFSHHSFTESLLNNIDIDALTAELIRLGFSNEDIESTLKDVRYRLKWTVGSECFVYSRSIKKWIGGRIKSISADGVLNVDLLTVHYGQRKKDIERFSHFIKPKEFGDEYQHKTAIIKLIVDRLKKENVNKNKGTLSCKAKCKNLIQLKMYDE